MAVLPSPSNTSAPESQGFEANLDDLFLHPAEEKTHPVLKVLYNFTHSLSA